MCRWVSGRIRGGRWARLGITVRECCKDRLVGEHEFKFLQLQRDYCVGAAAISLLSGQKACHEPTNLGAQLGVCNRRRTIECTTYNEAETDYT